MTKTKLTWTQVRILRSAVGNPKGLIAIRSEHVKAAESLCRRGLLRSAPPDTIYSLTEAGRDFCVEAGL